MMFKKCDFTKKRKITKCLTALFFTFFIAGFYTTSSAQTKKGNKYTSSQEAIRQVIDDFQMGIINKDKQRFMSTFYPDSTQVSWISVTADSVMKIRRRKIQMLKKSTDLKNLPKLKQTSVGTPAEMIENIVSSSAHFEEIFHNVKIVTDGNVASVTFDYKFQVNGKTTNYGQEYWHLVHTNNGWKINSVIWSVIPTKPRFPSYNQHQSSITLSSKEIKIYIGTYSSKKQRKIKVLTVNRTLVAMAPGETPYPFPLIATNKTAWQLGKTGIVIKFDSLKSGKYQQLTLQMGERSMIFKRK